MEALSASSWLIPKDLTLHIFSYLSFSQLGICAQVSKIWKKISEDNFLWKPLAEANVIILSGEKNTNWRAFFKESFVFKPHKKLKSLVAIDLSKKQEVVGIMSLHIEGSRIYCGLSNHSILVWNAFSSVLEKELKGHQDWVRSLHTDSHFLYSGGSDSDKGLFVWDKEQGGLIHSYYFKQAVTYINKIEDHIVSSSWDGTIRYLKLEIGLETVIQDDIEFTTFKFHNNLLYTGSFEGVIKIWDPQKNKCLNVLKGHQSLISSIDAYEDDIYSASFDGTIRIWKKNKNYKILKGHKSAITAMQLRYPYLVSCSNDRSIGVWDLSQEPIQVNFFKAHMNDINCLKVIGKYILTGSWDGTLKIWY